MIYGQGPLQGHSAHVGQLVEFHYRWHPYYGGRFRHEGREERANGAIVRVEIKPGEIIQVPAWMLDRALCVDMELGVPLVAVSGLTELHRLLTLFGFRQTSADGLNAIQEARDESLTTTSEAADADQPAEHAARYARAAEIEPDGAKFRGCPTGDAPDGGRRRRNRGDQQ